jgi:hypothetical protein
MPRVLEASNIAVGSGVNEIVQVAGMENLFARTVSNTMENLA